MTVQCVRCRRCGKVLNPYSTKSCMASETDSSVLIKEGFERISRRRPVQDVQFHRFKCREWKGDMWLATAAIQKAFGYIQHDIIWIFLRNQSISKQHMSPLLKMYDGHTATVLTDVESESFRTSRGTPQRVFLPSLSCNSVRQSAMESDSWSWREKSLGLKLEDDKKSCMSNLRFADDVLLVVNSLRQLKKMMTDIKRRAE